MVQRFKQFYRIFRDREEKQARKREKKSTKKQQKKEIKVPTFNFIFFTPIFL